MTSTHGVFGEVFLISLNSLLYNAADYSVFTHTETHHPHQRSACADLKTGNRANKTEQRIEMLADERGIGEGRTMDSSAVEMKFKVEVNNANSVISHSCRIHDDIYSQRVLCVCVCVCVIYSVTNTGPHTHSVTSACRH